MITERATVCGHQVAVLRRDPDADDGVDPCFFEADFTVAASTARLIWEGSWALVELLRRERDSWLRELVRGRRVLELGAGTGMLGLAAAAAGGHVLMTDVASMTEESLAPNVRANVAAGGGCPSWTGSDSAVSSGSAAAQALDWLLPLEAQRHPVDVFAAEIVLAAECAWLEELVDPSVATLAALLRAVGLENRAVIPSHLKLYESLSGGQRESMAVHPGAVYTGHRQRIEPETFATLEDLLLRRVGPVDVRERELLDERLAARRVLLAHDHLRVVARRCQQERSCHACGV